MRDIWLQLQYWYYQRQLDGLWREIDHHDKYQRQFGNDAYYINMMKEPMKWATAINYAKWHGAQKERNYQRLDRIRDRLSTLQQLDPV